MSVRARDGPPADVSRLPCLQSLACHFFPISDSSEMKLRASLFALEGYESITWSNRHSDIQNYFSAHSDFGSAFLSFTRYVFTIENTGHAVLYEASLSDLSLVAGNQ